MLGQELVFSMNNIDNMVAEKEAELDTLVSKITGLQALLQVEEEKLFQCVNEKSCLLNLQSTSEN